MATIVAILATSRSHPRLASLVESVTCTLHFWDARIEHFSFWPVHSPMKKWLVIALLVLLAIIFTHTTRDVVVTVENQSAASITNAVLVGSGFSLPVSSLPPGAKQQIHLKSNSGTFKLQFDASGKHFTAASPAEPWKGVKEAILTITNNFTVDSSFVTTF